MDHISIDNLEVFAYHGMYKEEETLGQKFLVSAKLYFDATAAGASDDLTKSVNYAKVCKGIDEWMKTNRCKLIATVAQRLANKLLRENKIVRETEVTVRKPWAPIGLPVECVSITVRRRWHTAYLSIGSNMGDKEKYLRDSLSFIKKDGSIRVLQTSEFIVTKPYGKTDQDDFLNAAVKIETILCPNELLDVLHEAEDAAERVRTEHWGPRTLDMDILLYDNLIVNEEGLSIPHPDMANRDFVLRPFNEIAPNAYHPVLRKTVGELLALLKA